ncbi:MAG: hypothetical protein HOP30_00085 [Cyclobacteriaceae bacterium]|nr:hypothetical protein [Cyclobacteriaceae bacterium]
MAHKFVAIWKLGTLPEFAVIQSKTADATKAPNIIGKENARKTSAANKKEIKDAAIYWLSPRDLDGDIFVDAKNLTTESFAVLKILNNLDSDRIQINPHNFINEIEQLKSYFDTPIDAVHAFYTMVAYWDITSKASVNEAGDEIRVIGFNGNKFSDPINLHPHKVNDLVRFINTKYIFTNEGSGLTVDHYFSRFDEVMAKIDPEYVKQHGIFFTDSNLSKFALWYAKYHFPGNINENYIVFDPAGGSGNLVSSWRGKLKHKIVSELQPDLLRTIERRMKVDPFHIETGFTIVPKTSENKGLNFLDRSGAEYLSELKKELSLKNIKLDKPIAFLLNPPYKNTDENVKEREKTEAAYEIHPSIYELTGEDAGKERYLAFLGQILNIAKEQEKEGLHPVVLIFTPTSWLIPRPTYVEFRNVWDKYFRFHSGFLTTSNEFFKIEGRWPLAFTIWNYEHNEKAKPNIVKVHDLTHFSHSDLDRITWTQTDEVLDILLNKMLKKSRKVRMDNSRGDIRENLPLIIRDGKNVRQPRLNLYRNKTKDEEGHKVVSGFPLDDDRHQRIKAPHGFVDGSFIGFMDDNTPVRLRQEPCKRLSNYPDRVWLQLRPTFIDTNLTKVQTGPQDKYAYSAYDLQSGKATMSWFAITKALNGNYPLWVNQYDIWAPTIKPEQEKYWYSLCFAFVLAENRCVVTKFEKDNPVKGALEVFVDNPLCPTNPESFWSKTLDKEIAINCDTAKQLVDKVKELYKFWNTKYCKGQWMSNVGLHNEPYFKYFNYADFLTPHSGLVQIRKYAEKGGIADLLEKFDEVSVFTKKAKEEIHRLLVDEFKYFD